MLRKFLILFATSFLIVGQGAVCVANPNGEPWWIEDETASLPTLVKDGWKVIGYDVSTEIRPTGYVTRFRYLLEHSEEVGNYTCSELFSVANGDDPVSQVCARLR